MRYTQKIIMILFLLIEVTCLGKSSSFPVVEIRITSDCDTVVPLKFTPVFPVIKLRDNNEMFKNVSNGTSITYQYTTILLCRSNGKWGLISEEGEELFPCRFDTITANGRIVILTERGNQQIYSADLKEQIVSNCSNFRYFENYYIYSDQDDKFGIRINDKTYGIPFKYDSIVTDEFYLKGGAKTTFAFCYLSDSLFSFRWNSDSLWQTASFNSRFTISARRSGIFLIQSQEEKLMGALNQNLKLVCDTQYQTIRILKLPNGEFSFLGKKKLNQFEIIRNDSIVRSFIADSISPFTDWKSIITINQGKYSILNYSGEKLTSADYDDIVVWKGKCFYRLGDKFGSLNVDYQPIENEEVTHEKLGFNSLQEIQEELLVALKSNDEEKLEIFSSKLHPNYWTIYDLINERQDHRFLGKDFSFSKELFLKSSSDFLDVLKRFKEKIMQIDPALKSVIIIGFQEQDFHKVTDNLMVHESPLIIQVGGQQFRLTLGELYLLKDRITSFTRPKFFN